MEYRREERREEDGPQERSSPKNDPPVVRDGDRHAGHYQVPLVGG